MKIYMNHRCRRQDEMVIRVLEALTSSDIIVLPKFQKSIDLIISSQVLLSWKWSEQEKKKIVTLLDIQNPCLKEQKVKQFFLRLFEHRRMVFDSVIGIRIKGMFNKEIKITTSNNFTYLMHALKLANAVHLGILTCKGQEPYFTSAFWKKGLLVNRSTVNTYPLLCLCMHFLSVFPKGLLEKDLIKRIKLSLAGKFALIAKQELPGGYPQDAFPVMPKSMEINLLKSMDKKTTLQLFFSIYQSKGLCQSVPETFLKDGLLKHRSGICKEEKDVIVKNDQLYQMLKEYSSQKFGKIISDLYNPFKTVNPSNSACLENSRVKGGQNEYLQDKKQFHIANKAYSLDEQHRVEPLVIGLFGPPGLGKTRAIKELLNFFNSRLFNLEENLLVYNRSCNVKHWDKYSHQPIVVLDDFGQNLTSRDDIIEFDQLISCNPYYLPMANLNEKGILFNSPIVIITSNLAFGSSLALANENSPILDIYSLWRRIHVPISLVGRFYDSRYQLLSLVNLTNHRQQNGLLYHGYQTATRTIERDLQIFATHNRVPLDVKILKEDKSLFKLGLDFQKLYIDRLNFHKDNILGIWTQSIYDYDVRVENIDGDREFNVNFSEISQFDRGIHSQLTFPIHPPLKPPVIQGIPLAEPLKVRVITKAEADTRCLKPLQMAMWKSLTFYEEFNLTHGCNQYRGHQKKQEINKLEQFEKIEQEIKRISSSEGIYVSGDYDAATDNLPMWVTEGLLEGILEHIDHQPTKDWARYEISSHIVTYPSSYDIPEGIQTSGQLMGSLLSFPLLCMANDFLCSVLSNFPSGSYLINGDDIVGKVPQECIQKWKDCSSSIGLTLSLGKNFIDKNFCTVNSQLFYKTERLNTGKVELLYRQDKTLGECWRDFQSYYGMNEIFFNHFIRNNFHRLKESPRSLWVSTEQGGMGLKSLHNKSVNQSLAKRVYFCSLFKKLFKDRSKVLKKITNHNLDILCIPVFLTEKNKQEYEMKSLINETTVKKLDGLLLPSKEEKESDFLTRKELNSFIQRTLPQFPGIKDLIDKKDLYIHHLPSLKNFKCIFKFVHRSICNDLQRRHNLHFMNSLCSYLNKKKVNRNSEDNLFEIAQLYDENVKDEKDNHFFNIENLINLNTSHCHIVSGAYSNLFWNLQSEREYTNLNREIENFRIKSEFFKENTDYIRDYSLSYSNLYLGTELYEEDGHKNFDLFCEEFQLEGIDE